MSIQMEDITNLNEPKGQDLLRENKELRTKIASQNFRSRNQNLGWEEQSDFNDNATEQT